MKGLLAVALLAAGGCVWHESAREPQTRQVDEFDLSSASCGLGKRVLSRLSADGHPLTVSGKTYAHGFGTHPESAVVFAANGKVAAFDALVAIDDDAKDAGSGKSYGKPIDCRKCE